MTDLPPTIGPKAKGASNHAADNHTAAPSREVVVLDPFNLVPDSAVLPTGVALARRSPETIETRAPEEDAIELTAALVDGDDRKPGHRTALSRLIQSAPVVPLLIADAGEQASWRYVEFFTANIRNANTRRAYARACGSFLAWCEERGLTLTQIRPHDVGAYIEALQASASAPSVKQQLAAIRMLFDWLVVGQVMPNNPASSVRGPKHVVKTGKTPVLEADEWRRLIDSIPTETVRDLRDRALIATLTYGFARITAALKMKVEDLRPRGAGWVLRLHEKGGKQHAMPCHHAAAEALHAYIAAAGIADDKKGWLFRTAKGHVATALSDKPMDQADAWCMVRRRAIAAGIMAPIGNHSFRATGITAYLANGGTLEHAQAMAAHESPRTTKLYDRTKERLTQDEVERIRL